MSEEIKLKGKGGSLEQKVDSLRAVTLALLKEVKSLGELKSVEITSRINFADEVRRFEKQLIANALEQTGGHQSNAARLLNLKPQTLNEKIKRFAIHPVKVICEFEDA